MAEKQLKITLVKSPIGFEKSQGSANLLNVAMATLSALESLQSAEETAAMRGKPINEVRPFWERKRADSTE